VRGEDERQYVRRRAVLAGAACAALPLGAGPARGQGSAASALQKSISLIVRKTGTTPDQFKARWLGEHGPGARSIPGIQGFILGEVVPEPGRPAPDVALDGITESWQAAGIDRAAQARADPHVRAWLSAAPSYMDAITIYVTREHVFVPPVRRGVKIMTLIKRKPGTPHDEFVAHVLDVHGPLSARVPGLGGYVMSEIVRTSAMPTLPHVVGLGEIDIIGESWLGEGSRGAPDTPERRQWLADGAATFGSFQRYAMIEHVFVPTDHLDRAHATDTHLKGTA